MRSLLYRMFSRINSLFLYVSYIHKGNKSDLLLTKKIHLVDQIFVSYQKHLFYHANTNIFAHQQVSWSIWGLTAHGCCGEGPVRLLVRRRRVPAGRGGRRRRLRTHAARAQLTIGTVSHATFICTGRSGFYGTSFLVLTSVWGLICFVFISLCRFFQ